MQSEKRLGDYFRRRSEKGAPGLPLLSVTMNNGLVHRDTLERKTDTNLDDEDHLLIKKGDIAYNMMRMWQGASGLADRDGLVSPAYIVVTPKNGIDPLFASYWFKSPRMVYLFWAYSYGLTGDRLRLYFKDFAKVPAVPPSLVEQKRIGTLFLACDQAIEQTNKLIAAKQRLKRGLMQQLLTGERRFVEFGRPADGIHLPSGWVKKPLREVGAWKSGGTPSMARREYWENGTIPWVSSQDIKGRVPVPTRMITATAVAESSTNVVPAGSLLMVIRSGILRHTFPVVITNCEIAINQDIRALIVADDVNRSFVLEALLLSQSDILRSCAKAGTTVESIDYLSLKKYRITLPSRKEQDRIAALLAVVQSEIDLLCREVALLHKQKRGLMQKLLSGEVRTNQGR